MTMVDSLQADGHCIVSSGVLMGRLSRRCCACNASASASHLALRSNVQTSCLERADSAALGAFAGALTARTAALPGRRCPERQRRAKAESKTKGGGTYRPAKPVCTWGWRGTERRRRCAVRAAKPASMLAFQRASHDRTCQGLQGAAP